MINFLVKVIKLFFNKYINLILFSLYLLFFLIFKTDISSSLAFYIHMYSIDINNSNIKNFHLFLYLKYFSFQRYNINYTKFNYILFFGQIILVSICSNNCFGFFDCFNTNPQPNSDPDILVGDRQDEDIDPNENLEEETILENSTQSRESENPAIINNQPLLENSMQVPNRENSNIDNHNLEGNNVNNQINNSGNSSEILNTPDYSRARLTDSSNEPIPVESLPNYMIGEVSYETENNIYTQEELEQNNSTIPNGETIIKTTTSGVKFDYEIITKENNQQIVEPKVGAQFTFTFQSPILNPPGETISNLYHDHLLSEILRVQEEIITNLNEGAEGNSLPVITLNEADFERISENMRGRNQEVDYSSDTTDSDNHELVEPEAVNNLANFYKESYDIISESQENSLLDENLEESNALNTYVEEEQPLYLEEDTFESASHVLNQILIEDTWKGKNKQ